MSKKGLVYKFYNKDKELIYVGLTSNIGSRLSTHKKETPWFKEVKTIYTSNQVSYNLAAIYEIYIITNDNPKYNKQFNNDNDSIKIDIKKLKFKKYTQPIKSIIIRNSDFTQIYFNNIDVCNLSASSLKTLLYLSKITFDNTLINTEIGSSIITFRNLEDRLKLCRKTLARCIKELADNNIIKIFKTNASNIYAINPNILWKSSDALKKKALFNLTQTGFTKSYVVKGNLIIKK